MTDSIPLFAVVAKLLIPVLPRFDQAVTVYQAFSWVMQPVAAVFALRSVGERRLLPAIAIALMASSMPTFLFRIWHAALSGHFFLLLLIGLYFRIIKGSSASLYGAGMLQVGLLLIHPYLMFMATVVFFAAPLTQFIRGTPEWRRSAVACGISSVLMLLTGLVFGYWGAPSDGGFGYYSMNLLGPFWPTFSTLFPGIRFAPADGTGGQAEGYQYLGLGLFVLLVVSACGWRIWYDAMRRHPGLLVACILLYGLAVTNWIYFLHSQIIHIPFRSTLLSQVRGSGRLFWPVSYLLLIGSVFVVCRRFTRVGFLVVSLASVVQLRDTSGLRDMDHQQLTLPMPYSFDEKALSIVLSHYRRLTVLPTFPCNGGGTAPNEDVIWVAAKQLMEINSVYIAREKHAQSCFPDYAMHSRTAPDEMRVILPGFLQSSALIPNHNDDCRLFGSYILCTRQSEFLHDIPAYAIKPIPTSVSLPIKAASPGADSLLAGWSAAMPTGGVWSVSTTALLGGQLSPAPSGNLDVKITASAMPLAGLLGVASYKRPVSVWAGGRHIGNWSISPTPSTFEVVVPKSAIGEHGLAVLELRTETLSSSLDLGFTPDPRRFGILLKSVSFTPASQSVP